MQLDYETESKIAQCWDIVNSATGAEERRAYEWRVMPKQLKKWVLNRAGFDPLFFDKALHTFNKSERLQIRRSLERTIKELETVRALMCHG
jgi:hypothetical protein